MLTWKNIDISSNRLTFHNW